MLSVTEQALEALREQIPNRNVNTAIRIYVQGGCCSGPHLKICVDQAKEDDHIVDFIISVLLSIGPNYLLWQYDCGFHAGTNKMPV